MLVPYLVKEVPGVAVGLVVGSFMPAVGRKIKALFVKESAVVKADVAAKEASAASAVKKAL